MSTALASILSNKLFARDSSIASFKLNAPALFDSNNVDKVIKYTKDFILKFLKKKVSISV